MLRRAKSCLFRRALAPRQALFQIPTPFVSLRVRQFSNVQVAQYNKRSSDLTTINGEFRFQTGKYISKWLRIHGRVPGLVFTPNGQFKEILSFDDAELVRLVRTDKYWLKNTVYNLKLNANEEYGKAAKEMQVLIKDARMHPSRRGHVMNLILIEFEPGKKYSITMPIRFEGIEDCKGYREGGVFLFGEDEIEVNWRGDINIPRDLVCNLVPVEKGTSIKLSDLGALPAGLTLRGRVSQTDPVVCHVAKSGGESTATTPPWKVVEEDWRVKVGLIEAEE